jgi:hypothetical protein
MRDSQKSDTSADDVYVSILWYYDLLSFIAFSEIPKRGKSNMNLVDVTDDGDKPEMDCAKITTYKYVLSYIHTITKKCSICHLYN